MAASSSLTMNVKAHDFDSPGKNSASLDKDGITPGSIRDLLVAEVILLRHLDRLGLEHTAMLACAIVQPHPNEPHIRADSAVKPMPAHVDLRLGRKLEVHRSQ